MFIIGMSQAFAFTLTIEQIPHHLGHLMVGVSHSVGTWAFLLVSLLLLIVMGAMLEGAAALIFSARSGAGRRATWLQSLALWAAAHPWHGHRVLRSAFGSRTLYLLRHRPGIAGGGDETRPEISGGDVLCTLVVAYVPEISLMLPHYFGYR